MKRTLKRVDLTSRTLLRVHRARLGFAGSLFELALAADRSYMFHDDNEENVDRAVADELRAADDEQRADAAADALPRRRREDRGARGARRSRSTRRTPKKPASSPSRPTRSTGTTRCGVAIEARAAFSPDAMTGLEANLRFAGPETMETKIFGRLTAWQNWIFQRPNAVGDKGALQGVRTAGTAGVRLEADMSTSRALHRGHRGTQKTDQSVPDERGKVNDLCREDPEQRQPLRQQAAAARARALAAEVHPVVEGHGAAGLPGLPPGLRPHRDQRRPGRVGALRVREAARVPLGHLPRRSDPRSQDRLRRFLRPGRSGRRCRASSATSCAA